MVQLLTNYSLGQIVLFVVIAAIALKESITFLDWANDKIHKKIKKEQQPEDIAQKLTSRLDKEEQEISELKQNMMEIQESIKLLNTNLQMLIASDRDAIKAWLTSQHHHFMEMGEIDYYSFDCISKRYDHYKDEGGNTFIDDLMEDIINLPKIGDKKNIHNT